MPVEQLIEPVPAGWRATTLGEACSEGGGGIQTGPFGSQLHAADYVDGGIPSVMPRNIGDNRINAEGIAGISTSDAKRLSRYLLRPGDIVYSRRGDVERRALVRDHEDGWLCGTGCLRVRLGDGGVNPLFASYQLAHPGVRAWIVRHAIGATMPNLNTSILSALPFLLPPPGEQRAIAGILGTLDDKIELNRCMNEALEATARAIFKSWFVDFDPVCAKAEGRPPAGMDAEMAALFPDSFERTDGGATPVGWKSRAVADITLVIDCLHSKKPDRREAGRPLLQLWNIRNDGILDMSDPYWISEDDYALWSSRIEAAPGDCVVTNVGRVGAVAQIPAGMNAALGRNMTAVRCRPEYPFPTFLVETLLSDAMREEIALKTDSGTILDSLNVRNIPRLQVTLASKAVLERFERLCRPLRAAMETNHAESHTLATLRDTLLPKLLAGEVRA